VALGGFDMAEVGENTGRDRSPAYPIIPLGAALERLAQFEAHFKRSAARPEKVGDAWSIKAKAHADRIAAALRYFGLLEYSGAGNARSVAVSELGRNYLRAQQEKTKQEIIAAVALKPKQIATFWNEWGADRPADAACLDQLVLKNGFSEAGARDFLKVYDATIAYAKQSPDAKIMAHEVVDDDNGSQRDDQGLPPAPPIKSPVAPPAEKAKIMAGERELTTGLLSKDANFRLIVSGPVGVKEIERLIAKLELDKEILAESEEVPDFTQ
jgi:hypothetical protein